MHAFQVFFPRVKRKLMFSVTGRDTRRGAVERAGTGAFPWNGGVGGNRVASKQTTNRLGEKKKKRSLC